MTENKYTFYEPPTFPMTITVGPPEQEVPIVLRGDGSWSGDGTAFLEALKTAKGQTVVTPMLWFIANIIRRDLLEKNV